MMTMTTPRGTLVINNRWWPQDPCPITLTVDNVDEVLRALAIGLRDSRYNSECFSMSDLEFRSAIESQVNAMIIAFVDAGYNPHYIHDVFHRTMGDLRKVKLDYVIPSCSHLRPRPDAAFRITVNLPAYPLLQEWAQHADELS